MSRSSSRLNRFFLCRVLGLHLAVPTGLTLGVALRLLSGDQFAVPTIRLPVAPQQVAAVVLSLGVGWMLIDEWPRIVRTTPQRVAVVAVLRWGATQVVCVGSTALAVAGLPHYDAVLVGSLMCSFAALASVVGRQTWWIPPLLMGYLLLRVNAVIDPYHPVAHDLAFPLVVGSLSVVAYVGAALGRSGYRPSRVLS